MSKPLSQNSDSSNVYLEPRVAKLEVGLDRLTEDVRSLAGIVRDQGSNVEKQLQALTIAVTEAQAPKKTDWSVIISAGLLVLALGSAVFWPLNQTGQNNKDAIEHLTAKFEQHEAQVMPPVVQALIEHLELRVEALEQQNIRENERNADELQMMRDREMGLISPHISTITK
jgi:hypothetical protein